MTAQKLLGLAEIAEKYGISKNSANAWTRRHDFPHPIALLAMGPVWDDAEVTAWRTPAAQRKWALACGSCASPAVFLTGLSSEAITLDCHACEAETILTVNQGNESNSLGVTLTVKPKEA